MSRTSTARTFVDLIEQQLAALRDPEYTYSGLQLWVAGVSGPWEFHGADEFEFHEEVLIVRDGPTSEDGHDNADVPEYVFRLDSLVATTLV